MKTFLFILYAIAVVCLYINFTWGQATSIMFFGLILWFKSMSYTDEKNDNV